MDRYQFNWVAPPAKTLIIAIDFGTTYSGAAWRWSNRDSDPETTHVVTRWPTDNTEEPCMNPRVPTEIFYDRDTVHWGYNIPECVDPIKWFKFLLLDETDMPDHLKTSTFVKDARTKTRNTHKEPYMVIGDYLKQLYGHAIREFRRHDPITDREFARTPSKLVLTIPSTWKDYAKERMRIAVEHSQVIPPDRSRINQIEFLSESEAALSAVMTHPLMGSYGSRRAITVTIVDCGGGTMDMASYRIRTLEMGLHNLYPEGIKEQGKAASELSGSIFLDQAYAKLVRKTIGSQAWKSLTRLSVREIMDLWEFRIKCKFNGGGGPWSTTQRSIPPVQSNQIRDLFDSFLGKTIRSFGNHFDQARWNGWWYPQCVVLVGGLGRNPYILNFIKNLIYDNFKENIKRDQGEADFEKVLLCCYQLESHDSLTAVCRGAAEYGTLVPQPKFDEEWNIRGGPSMCLP
ncbi:hypothetical protein F4805DRAFT_429866 [Annulohypoxylon moriforme]|nr:hypothetical protein F4805DRAFT_429866 [Annulohypoxylon moriforme]